MIRNTILCIALACMSASHAADITPEEIAAASLVKEGAQAVDFTCTTTEGRSITLSSMRGKVVLLYFFSSTVPFSLTELGYIEREIVKKAAGRQDLVVVGIGRGHTRDEVVTLAGQNKLSLPLVADADQSLYRRYFTKFVPRTVVVARDGRVAFLATGYREFDGIVLLQKVIEQELLRPAP